MSRRLFVLGLLCIKKVWSSHSFQVHHENERIELKSSTRLGCECYNKFESSQRHNFQSIERLGYFSSIIVQLLFNEKPNEFAEYYYNYLI